MITKRTKQTIAEGSVGGLIGAVIGVPILGVALGVAHANKDKIKKSMRDNKW